MTTGKHVHVVVIHTVKDAHLQPVHGYDHGLKHIDNTPYAVVLWNSMTHKVDKIVKRYVTSKAALTAARRVEA